MEKETGAQLALKLLRNEKLSIEDRNLLTTALLDKLGAIPVRARITIDETGRCLVDGKELTVEKSNRLLASARALKRNFAYKLIQETVTFLAIKQGVHYNTSPEQGLFAKAILWQQVEEQQLLDKLVTNGLFGE